MPSASRDAGEPNKPQRTRAAPERRVELQPGASLARVQTALSTSGLPAALTGDVVEVRRGRFQAVMVRIDGSRAVISRSTRISVPYALTVAVPTALVTVFASGASVVQRFTVAFLVAVLTLLLIDGFSARGIEELAEEVERLLATKLGTAPVAPATPEPTETGSRAARFFEKLWRNADRICITIGAAATLAVLSAPTNWHWLHWVAYLPFFWVLRAETPRANRWFAFLYGTLGVGFIFRWLPITIYTFSASFSPMLAWALLALFSAAFGLPYVLLWSMVHPLRHRLGDWWILAIPALQVVIEFLTMYVLLFPYNHGVSQFRFAYTWQLVSVTGVWGLTYLLFFFNAAFAEGIYRAREGRPFPVRWAAVAVGTVSIVLIFGALRYDRIERMLTEAPTINVALIQTNKTMQHRFSESRKRALYAWVEETEALNEVTEPGDVDLVVWSEGASPYNVHEGGVYRIIRRLVTEGGYELLVGGGTVDVHGDPDADGWVEAYNSVYLFGSDGAVLGRYDKVIPLPFGEYMPFASVIPWLRDIQGVGDFRAGSQPVVLEGSTHRMASPICYEAILSSTCRGFLEPDLLVNVTNDAWFGDTAAPHQHAMLAAVRATELGLPLIREGYTGISMIVEPHGRIHSETPPFTRANHVVRVRIANIPTIYRRFGDWFVLLCAAGLLGAWIGRIPARRDEKAAS